MSKYVAYVLYRRIMESQITCNKVPMRRRQAIFRGLRGEMSRSRILRN